MKDPVSAPERGPELPREASVKITKKFRIFFAHLLKFGIVGAINTVLGYLFFSGSFLFLFRGISLGYLFALVLSYLMVFPVSFWLYAKLVFPSGARSRAAFTKFFVVYLLGLSVNFFILPALVELVRLSPILGQAIALVFTAAFSYVGHRFISFRN